MFKLFNFNSLGAKIRKNILILIDFRAYYLILFYCFKPNNVENFKYFKPSELLQITDLSDTLLISKSVKTF